MRRVRTIRLKFLTKSHESERREREKGIGYVNVGGEIDE